MSDTLPVQSPPSPLSGKYFHTSRHAKTRHSLEDAAYEGLKRKILTLEFMPGAYLSEAFAAETLGLGRNPVHHAVKRLVFEGMLDVMPRKGLIIRPLDLQEILEIAEARLINEVFCARRAAEQASASEIKEMRRILEKSHSALKARDTEVQMFLDRDFHCAIFKASRNTLLEEMLRILHERSLRAWFISLKEPKQAKGVLEQHFSILAAIEAHKPDAAEQSMRQHIEASRENLHSHV